MTEAAQLKILRTSPEIRELLERDFDFEPLKVVASSRLFQFSGNGSCELIATDASGGEFALCQSDKSNRPVLYVSSEGQAGIIARSLEEGLSTMAAIPHWHDCLKFSGGGQLDEMRRVFPFSEAEALEEVPHLDSSRRILRIRLELPVLNDPVYSLYSAVTELTPYFPVQGTDGLPFSGLFNKFTVLSNPVWRRKFSELS